jgi:hypothetical protein
VPVCSHCDEYSRRCGSILNFVSATARKRGGRAICHARCHSRKAMRRLR